MVIPLQVAAKKWLREDLNWRFVVFTGCRRKVMSIEQFIGANVFEKMQ